MNATFFVIAGRVHYSLLLLQSVAIGGLLLVNPALLLPETVLTNLLPVGRYALGLLSLIGALLFTLPRTFRLGMGLIMGVLVVNAILKVAYGYGSAILPEVVGTLLFVPMFRIGYPWTKREEATT